MKTIKQVADSIGISKQKLYRYIKSHHISDVQQINSIMYIDEALEKQLYEHFTATSTSADTHQTTSNDVVIDALLMQLKTKDEQIERLTQLLDQEQQLHLQTQQKLLSLEEPAEKEVKQKEKSFLSKLFNK